MPRLSCFSGSTALALLLGGCGEAQTGGQTGGQVDSACSEKTHSVTLDQPSPLGFSVEQVLGVAEGARLAPLVWLPSQPDAGLAESITVTPQAGLSRIELAIEYAGGALQWVERVRQGEAGDAADQESETCSDSLLIEVQVAADTENGAFSDVFTGRLEASRPDRSTLRIDFDPEDLLGSFTVVIDDANVSAERYWISAQLSEGDFSGSVEGALEVPRGREPSGGAPRDQPEGSVWIQYGYWPASAEP
jgi:hypothetical protein